MFSKVLVLTLSFLAFANSAKAQNSKTPTAGPQISGPQLSDRPTSKNPVSVSYQNVVRCFPELTSDAISFKVDLNKLKDLMDEKFITSKSQLRQRKVTYVDAEDQEMILTLRTKNYYSRKQQTELMLQKVGDKGVVTDLALTANQRTNPKQEIINGFLSGANIKADEYSYNDTKLNGLVSTYRRNFKEIEEIDLSEKARKRSIVCEKQKDLGIICTCSKK